MTSVTENHIIPFLPNCEVADITADNGQTYTIKKGKGIVGAVFSPNRATAASDSWSVSFTRGGSSLTINLVGTTTSVRGTLIVWSKG